MTGFRLDEKSVMDVEKYLSLEWLETNGLGGYASSTIINCHTRRYHGLLVSNLAQPSGRFVLLSKLEDSLSCGEQEYFLTTHRYPGVFHPKGFAYQTSFSIDYCPCFTFRIGAMTVCKRIMMIQGKDRVMIRYSREGGGDPVILRVRPFIACRGSHELSRENQLIRKEAFAVKNGFRMRPYDGMPELFVQTGGKAVFSPSALWYRNFEYGVEKQRGFDFHEDLFEPGVFEIFLKEGSDVFVSAATGEFKGPMKAQWDREERRRNQQAAEEDVFAKGTKRRTSRETAAKLIRAGRAFLIKDHARKPAIVAGYHWFYEWGRDSLISLPGLTFCSGRPKEGIDLLKKFSIFEKNGLMPNFISEDGESMAYNTVDSALWYFWAVQQMLKYTGDERTLKKDLWPVMKRILGHYMSGTEYEICMNDNGLLHAGDQDSALTWMDAKADGSAVTPRSGFAVDINALWYNALCFANELAERWGDRTLDIRGYIDRMRESFQEIFWIESGRYLGDVSSDGRLDEAVRPNQILAVSLPFSPLEPSRRAGVVEKVRQDLLTPCGLRTLSESDPAYRGSYEGDSSARDRAYHQGTVWPWLLGHFGEAWLRTEPDNAVVKEFLLNYIQKFTDGHLAEAGIGFVSEVFDGDPPHHPGGCIAQAWSAAEMIRLMSLLDE